MEIGIELYGMSDSFDTADKRFLKMIRPFLDQYTRSELHLLLQKIEINGQTYARGRAQGDHRRVKEAIDRVLGGDFEEQNFPNFVESLGSSS